MIAVAASLASITAAQAQSFTWGGASATTNYNLGANWTPSSGAPPVAAGQSAVFGTTGSTAVSVSAAIAPDSWTFTANAQSYVITGSPVNFSLPGSAGGIINNANSGQTITISNLIGETFAGVQLQQLGNSTLILTRNNTFTGDTMISAGTLQLGNGGTTGNLSGNVIDNSILAFDRSNAVTYAGIISGTGQVQQIGTDTLVLSGANTYSGGTLVTNGGTVRVTNSTPGISSSVGTGLVTLDNGRFQVRTGGAVSINFSNNFAINGGPTGSALDSNGHTLTISGNITDGNGPGALTIMDSVASGKVVFTGTNTYSGGTLICSCATLQLGTTNFTGSMTGSIQNEGVFAVVNSTSSGITTITNEFLAPGFGGLIKYQGLSSAGSATIINQAASETDFLATSNAGTSTIINRAGAQTIFEVSSLGGSSHIFNRSGGETIFRGNSSADHATIITQSGGRLQFSGSATGGDATITTRSGAATYFFGNADGDNAQFITNGNGFVDFSGSTGPLGDGHIAAGSIAGSGFYYIGGGNTLTVGGNNLSTVVSGVIADSCGCGPAAPGTLEKIGSGTLTLSGANTYTGATLVNGGTLLVTGSIAPTADPLTYQVLVSNGATLGGTGTVPLTFLTSGAILAPGLPTALGTLTVNDVLSFCSCTFYDVKVTSGGNDLTQVVQNLLPGIASLEGTVRVTSLDNTYRFNSPYTILTAQGGFVTLLGPTQFNSLVTPAGINGFLTYTATDVDLTLSSALGQLPGLNVNQRNVANVLDTAFNTTGFSGALGAIFGSNVLQNLTQASGELATGAQQVTFDAMNLFMGLLTDPFIDGRGGSAGSGGGATPFADESASAYAAKKPNAARDAFAKLPAKADGARNDLFDPRWSVWGAAYGGGSNSSGNAALGSNATTARAFGFVAGADYRISPSTLAGFALAGGGTNFSVNGFGTGRSDLFQAGAFVRHNVGPAYVTAALAYGWQQITTDRTVTIAGIDQLHAQFNANAWSGRLEGGYRYVTPWMGGIGVTPYAAAQFTVFDLPAYVEQALVGANTFALSYAAKDVTAVRTELGARLDRSYALQNAILTLRGRFAWAHDYNSDRNIAATFQTLPGSTFVVNGAAQAHDAALTTVSAELKWLNGFSLAAAFEGEFSSVTTSYAGKGIARYTW